MKQIKKLSFKSILAKPFFRFLIVGTVATTIHYGVYLFALGFSINANLCYVIAFSISIICNFLMTSFFTFKVAPSFARGGKFMIAHLLNLLNELILLNFWLFVNIPTKYAPLLVFVVAFSINFFMVRWSMKSSFSLLSFSFLKTRKDNEGKLKE